MNEETTEHTPMLVIAAPLRLNWIHLAMWIGLFFLLMAFLRAVQPILLPFALGILIAYVMDPVVDRLVHHGMSRPAAAGIITLVLFTMVAAICVWLGPLLYHQCLELLSRVPGFLKEVEHVLQKNADPLLKTLNNITDTPGDKQHIPNSVDNVLQSMTSSLGGIISNLLASAATLLNLGALLLIAPVVSFYLVRDWPGVIARTDHLLPLAYAPTIREQLHQINKTLSAYLRGQLTVIVILTIYYCITFAILGVNDSLLIGLLAGVMVMIPYIGTLISIALGLTLAYSQFEGITTDWWFMVGIYGVGNILENQILIPKIVGDKVGLHPLWMLFGMLAGAVLFGFVGILLAVPITAALSVLVKYIIQRYLASTLYTQA